ncbi:E-selectin-like isoform X2 [Narcine bancroftii]|uniref:E-selectin-like isoform X2 n=1 Tax=Narcine bancroftii TaxID=1343680 RepID=UPI0038313B3C
MAFQVKIYDKHWVQKASHAWLLVVIYELVSWEGVQTWNYEYSPTNMTWPDAREYCLKSFTDLVAIQNQEEIHHLNQILPRNPTYYWIGIRKIGGVWTWVGTNKSLDKEAENWAAASCKPTSCSDNGECVETIGNYTCRCNEGFFGQECENAVKCDVPKHPQNGYQNCSHSGETFTYRSVCNYSCAEGFALNGSESQQCYSSGQWSSPIPTCEGTEQTLYVIPVVIGTTGAAFAFLPLIGYIIRKYQKKVMNRSLSL